MRSDGNSLTRTRIPAIAAHFWPATRLCLHDTLARCNAALSMAVRFAMLKHKGRQMAAEAVPTNGNNVVELAADIVSAYVSNNSVPTGDLPALINEVHAALKRAGTPAAADAPRGEPAVPIKKSITPDYLISLFDGKKYKSLKRHLRTSHNMTPQEYRSIGAAPDVAQVCSLPLQWVC